MGGRVAFIVCGGTRSGASNTTTTTDTATQTTASTTALVTAACASVGAALLIAAVHARRSACRGWLGPVAVDDSAEISLIEHEDGGDEGMM